MKTSSCAFSFGKEITRQEFKTTSQITPGPGKYSGNVKLELYKKAAPTWR
ncbi:MAG: hypothetical protein GW818_09630 [Flavobacteriales bacterium]|nr:hypothetical protein [Flavobacteriales bacterium]